jgi:hypothetical protein
MSDPQPEPPTVVSERLQAILERAEAASLAPQISIMAGDDDIPDETYLRLQFPNGRGYRRIAIDDDQAGALGETTFETVAFLGDYTAIVDKATGLIEATITSASPGIAGFNVPALWRLPGVEILDADEQDAEEAGAPDEIVRRLTPPKLWRLQVNSGVVSIEVSPPTPLAKVLFRVPVRSTLKITGAASSTHDEAVEVLERYGNAFLFDLDVVHGVVARIARERQRRRRGRTGSSKAKPQFPRNNYASQALDLYQYGRSAAGLPLLEYLAYYQAIEYYFPYFAREQTLNSVRATLLNPAFNASDDVDLNRLIGLTSVRNVLAERDQLRATMRASVSAADLRDFIESNEEYTEHFCSKKQSIKGVSAFQLQGDQADLRDQAADRIYSIRCRIVHSKQDGGGGGEDVLLPSSREVHSLQADIELVRLVAQRALIARAARA